MTGPFPSNPKSPKNGGTVLLVHASRTHEGERAAMRFCQAQHHLDMWRWCNCHGKSAWKAPKNGPKWIAAAHTSSSSKAKTCFVSVVSRGQKNDVAWNAGSEVKMKHLHLPPVVWHRLCQAARFHSFFSSCFCFASLSTCQMWALHVSVCDKPNWSTILAINFYKHKGV